MIQVVCNCNLVEFWIWYHLDIAGWLLSSDTVVFYHMFKSEGLGGGGIYKHRYIRSYQLWPAELSWTQAPLGSVDLGSLVEVSYTILNDYLFVCFACLVGSSFRRWVGFCLFLFSSDGVLQKREHDRSLISCFMLQTRTGIYDGCIVGTVGRSASDLHTFTILPSPVYFSRRRQDSAGIRELLPQKPTTRWQRVFLFFF